MPEYTLEYLVGGYKEWGLWQDGRVVATSFPVLPFNFSSTGPIYKVFEARTDKEAIRKAEQMSGVASSEMKEV